MSNIEGLSKGVKLVSIEFNTAVKYVTRQGFVNDFPITFEYAFKEYLRTFVGFKQREDYTIVKVNGVDCVRFNKDLVEGVSVTIRRITPAGAVPHIYQYNSNAQGGAEFNAKTIDENFEYLSGIVEEVEEYNSITMDSLDELDDSFMTTQEVAKEALSTANRANAKADSAINTATKADEKADGAIAASDKAVKTSIIAEGKSDSAIVKADSAVETAQGADRSAKEAVRIAKIADVNSDQAITSSNQANETASKAVSYSSNAIEVAEEAKAIAEGIDGKASEALEVSYRAEYNATEAVNVAQNIADTADAANATSKEAWDMAKTALDTTTGDFIVQELGDSTTKVISQKVTTDTLTAKQDKLEFVGDKDGKVMREGAYGLGGRVAEAEGGATPTAFFSPQKTGFYNGGRISQIRWGTYIALGRDGIHRIATNEFGDLYTAKVTGDVQEFVRFYSTDNTSTDSSGFLRVSGNKETFTKDLVTQSTGSSTTNVMSQKAVTDRLNSIESGHGTRITAAQNRADSAYVLANKKRDVSDGKFMQSSLTTRVEFDAGDAFEIGRRLVPHRYNDGWALIAYDKETSALAEGGVWRFPFQKSGTLLLDADITSNLGNSTTLVASQKLVSDIADLESTPVGTIQAFVGENAPNDKWLLCRGQAFSAGSYPDLAGLLPDLKIPDLRGVALRGLDANRGFDPERALLSYQEDAMQKITGSARWPFNGGYNDSGYIKSGALNVYKATGGEASPSGATSYADNAEITIDSSLVARSNTQNETTMKNVAVNFIIKAR